MKSLLLIPMALGTLLLASCAGTMPGKCTKCCESGGAKCEKSTTKCPKCGKAGCTSCKKM